MVIWCTRCAFFALDRQLKQADRKLKQACNTRFASILIMAYNFIVEIMTKSVRVASDAFKTVFFC